MRAGESLRDSVARVCADVQHDCSLSGDSSRLLANDAIS